MADLLRDRAVAGGPDPAALLGITALFGPAGHDPALIDPVRHWLTALYQTGARATLHDAAVRLSF